MWRGEKGYTEEGKDIGGDNGGKDTEETKDKRYFDKGVETEGENVGEN
jgi:hypothetical protein